MGGYVEITTINQDSRKKLGKILHTIGAKYISGNVWFVPSYELGDSYKVWEMKTYLRSYVTELADTTYRLVNKPAA